MIRVYHSLVYVEEYISIGICISWVKMKFVLGWGVPLLCMGFGGLIALTFAGNMFNDSLYLFSFDVLRVINWLCVKRSHCHFTASCVLYCLYEQSSVHISFCSFAILLGKLKHYKRIP